MKWAGNTVDTGEIRNSYKVLGRKPEGRRPFGWCRRRWEDNIRCILQKQDGQMWNGLICPRRGTRRTVLSPEDGGCTDLRHVDILHYTATQPRRRRLEFLDSLSEN